jgi:hypothetical protein
MTIDQVYEEAINDVYAMSLKGAGYESRILYGCKITKNLETGEVQILNTHKGGDYYEPMTQEQMKIFLDEGWRCGLYVVSLMNYRSKLDKIEESIQKQMNGHMNPKAIQSLKTSRERVMQRYSEMNQKYNQIKSTNNGEC